MLSINGQEIYMTRADTPELTVSALNDDGTDYEFQEEDKVFFRLALKPGREVVLEKECVVDVENNVAVLVLAEEDTQDLQFKVYRYEFELVTDNDAHYTFIADQPFEIGKEIELHDRGDN